MKRAKWPSIPSQHVRPLLDVEWAVDATVDTGGRCLVAIHRFSNEHDDLMLFPHEAERIAKALLKCAEVARAKKKAAAGAAVDIVTGGGR